MPTNAQLLSRIHRRAANLTPEMRAQYLRAFRLIRDSTTTNQWYTALQSGQVEALLNTVLSDDVLAAGPLAEFRQMVQQTSMGAGTSAFNAIPRSIRKGGRFNTTDPKVLDAVASLETRVVNGLGAEVRETVRQHIAIGLNDGKGPRAIARGIRPSIGLAPNQEEAVRNFRLALEGDPTKGSPLTRKLRDRRFDRTLAKGEALTTKQMDAMENAYRRRWIAHNAETQARSFTLDAQRQGQRNAWESAAGDGLVDRGRLMHTWVTTMDGRERPEHAAMNGESVPFDQPYSNGQMIPGETDFNCRCTERFTQSRQP